MATTIGGKRVATTSSNHQAIFPPTPSNIPPMAPPTPQGVPAPFPHKGNTGTASGASSKLKVGGGKAVVEGNEFDVDPPGNNPSQPAPIHDLVTGVINKKIKL
jgi:hypothetical protein